MNNSGRDRLCWPLSVWPAIDQERWAAGLLPHDPFRLGGPSPRRSPATVRKTASGYGRYLAWLDTQGKHDPAAPISERVNPELVAAYRAHLSKVNRGHTIQCRIQELGDALRILFPQGDWNWIGRAAGRLRASTIAARDKRPRLRPLDELAAESLLLLQQAEQAADRSERRRALLYRDGLMALFLCFHPIRLRNFAGLRLGKHILENGHQLVLSLPPEETKARSPYESMVPALLLASLERYLHHYRRVLLGARPRSTPATDALWVSDEGMALHSGTITVRVRKATGMSGPPVTPHMIRTCAATTIAIRAPGSIDVVPATLGHTDPETSEQYYIKAGSLEASRAQSQIVERFLRQPRDHRPQK